MVIISPSALCHGPSTNIICQQPPPGPIHSKMNEDTEREPCPAMDVICRLLRRTPPFTSSFSFPRKNHVCWLAPTTWANHFNFFFIICIRTDSWSPVRTCTLSDLSICIVWGLVDLKLEAVTGHKCAYYFLYVSIEMPGLWNTEKDWQNKWKQVSTDFE